VSKCTRIVDLVQVLLCDDANRVLLGRHSEEHLLPQRTTGMIGELKPGENWEEGAVRVLQENCGLKGYSGKLEMRAVLDFIEADGTLYREKEVFAFYDHNDGSKKWEQTALMEEIAWWPLSNIPYAIMPADDRIWYPVFLKSPRTRPFTGTFRFDGDVLMWHELHL